MQFENEFGNKLDIRVDGATTGLQLVLEGIEMNRDIFENELIFRFHAGSVLKVPTRDIDSGSIIISKIEDQ